MPFTRYLSILTLLAVIGLGQAALAQSDIPGSFTYGGQSSQTLLPTWAKTVATSISPEGRQVDETTWQEPDGGLTATWRVEHLGQNSAEYRWIFENKGTTPTKVLSSVAAIDLTIANADRMELTTSTGGLDGPSAFNLSKKQLSQSFTLSADTGRSSNKDLPLWIIQDTTANVGKYVGVGWSGQWQADFRPVAGQNASRMTAGMSSFNIAVPTGERIVSASILVGEYQGNAQAGANALRRIINDEYVAKLGDKRLAPPVSWNSWFTFDNNVNDVMLRRQVDAVAGLGVEYFCIDAGWFTGAFDAGLGNWTPDPAKFPGGLRPIGEYVAQKGMKLGLWFEPGRAMPGTRLATEHPEWVYRNQVKLELPEARDWLFNEMCKNIDDGNVGWIRYDMNQGYFAPDPLTAWTERDTPYTLGLTQIRYLQGEYELLDRLREKYPEMVIESCASGGRRIDLETIRRAHTFWKSDETNNLIVARSQETGGNMFLPGGLLNTNLPNSSNASTFDLRSLFAGPLGFATDWTRLDDAARQRVADAIAEYKQVRHLLNKDYYPLFPQTTDTSQWVGWEFFDPATGEGFMTILRPEDSAISSATVLLGGVDPGMTYELSRLDGSQVRQIAGAHLLSGLPISLEPGGSELLRFQAIETPEPASLTLIGSGLLGLLAVRNWKTRSDFLRRLLRVRS